MRSPPSASRTDADRYSKPGEASCGSGVASRRFKGVLHLRHVAAAPPGEDAASRCGPGALVPVVRRLLAGRELVQCPAPQRAAEALAEALRRVVEQIHLEPGSARCGQR